MDVVEFEISDYLVLYREAKDDRARREIDYHCITKIYELVDFDDEKARKYIDIYKMLRDSQTVLSD